MSYLHEEDEAEMGPSVESTDPQDRINARRTRIATRIEAKRREALGEDPNAVKEVKEDLSKSRKQIEDSRQRLTKLQRDGTELVSNIQVAGDSREAQRRIEQEEARRQRTEKMENEAKASQEKFEDITRKWMTTNTMQIPQDFRDLLNMQQQQCAFLIEEKNKLISDLQKELKLGDDRYVKDLKKQGEDISLMIERMEEQIKTLSRSYHEELLQIERSFELERHDLMESNDKQWEQMMQARRDQELDYLITRMKRVEEQEMQLEELRTVDAEEYNIIKIKLETDVQILEQQLQQMKATYQLNQEKLEYNFQVLKKRDEENTITKSQQKRKITRQQDVLNNLKIKLAKQEKQYREDNQALTDDYKRITEKYKDLQRKMRHFAAVDSSNFRDIWLMNEEEVKMLVRKALEADRIIHEQQLGMPWKMPVLWFMDNVGPIIPEHKKKRTAVEVAKEVIISAVSQPGEEGSQSFPFCLSSSPSGSQVPEEKSKIETDDSKSSVDKPQWVSLPTVKRLLEILCDESGFLIESKLLKLLLPLERDEQSLMKLDSIFAALGIENEDDVFKLANFFIKYKRQQDASLQDAGIDAQEAAVDSKEKTDLQSEKGSRLPASSKLAHADLVHPNDVLKALRAFVSEYHKSSFREKHQQTKLDLEERDDSDDTAYWDAMANAIPVSKLKVWDALKTALEKYYYVLTERLKLLTQTDSLKQQNLELRMLLHQYINSKMTAELEIPPTHVFQQTFNES
ncbi:dynein regulatory complex protein 1 isoform X1 [Latimeria chalumnae]|uniref:Dynein regulatory complex protein 1 n=1 Tax=Latimeria chalumnae TaxID=7897 RepID=M3XKW7_LATCH|nr:PREDICTED: dynein regulatory complex protein 1 isoform X1 [Latimeria chalumnae]|eukprot:XP_005990963.1 PREDICTED: dynein regulatory complex protein 1 isoform X1 [Latimeria chalumnae]